MRPRLRKTFPRFPFVYFGNLGKTQIRGQNCFLQTCHRKKTEQNTISSIFRGPSLAKLKVNFPTLYDTLQLNDNSIWSAFSRGQMSEEEEVPVQLAKRMTPFQKV